MGCRFLGVMRGGGTGGAALSSGAKLMICECKKRKKEKKLDWRYGSVAAIWGSRSRAHLFALLDKYLDHDVLELDVQHGRHGVLLGSHQRWPEDDRHVGGGHSVFFAVAAHAAKHTRRKVAGQQHHNKLLGLREKVSENTNMRSMTHTLKHV